MTDEEVQQVEVIVNAKIRENLALNEKRCVPMSEAEQMGAMMLFGEKYGDAVRVIQFGSSVELCGGCHVSSTAQIGVFKISSETGVAAGIRRIEAITSEVAFEYYIRQEETLNTLRSLLKNSNDPVKGVESLIKDKVKLEKKVAVLVAEKAKGLKTELLQSVIKINGVNFIGALVDLEPVSMKDLSVACKKELGNLVMVLGANNNGKANLSVAVSDDLTERLNAGAIIREISKEIQGSGGGQAFFATAGGKNPEGLREALEKAKTFL